MIGLFHGMCDQNIRRGVQKTLKAAGITMTREVNEEGEGLGHAVLQEPDGNTILLDQF